MHESSTQVVGLKYCGLGLGAAAARGVDHILDVERPGHMYLRLGDVLLACRLGRTAVLFAVWCW